MKETRVVNDHARVMEAARVGPKGQEYRIVTTSGSKRPEEEIPHLVLLDGSMPNTRTPDLSEGGTRPEIQVPKAELLLQGAILIRGGALGQNPSS